MSHNFERLSEIIDSHPCEPESLIMILQDIQKEYKYLPCEALQETAKSLNVPLSKVFSVSTFYNAFSLKPRGETLVRVCVGTACHIRGAKLLQEKIEAELKIVPGETTVDKKFTLEVVGCVGACAMAPVVLVDDTYHGTVQINQVKKLVKGKK
jgi:NADH-quinone oxidoreductase subunit E